MAFRDRSFPSGVTLEEDPIRNALLDKPSIHTAIHPRPREPFLNQIWACRDALYDHHSDAVNMAKLTLVGGLIGGLVGFTGVFLVRTTPTFAMRKAFKHMRDNTFGTLHIYKEVLMPFVLGGAATGFSYFMFWKVFWGADVGKGVTTVLGNGIFSALAVSALYSPKYWWAGLYGGAFAGFCYYSIMCRNQLVHKNTGNVLLRLTGVSEEERERQKNKDIIHELGMNPLIEQNRLTNL